MEQSLPDIVVLGTEAFMSAFQASGVLFAFPRPHGLVITQIFKNINLCRPFRPQPLFALPPRPHGLGYEILAFQAIENDFSSSSLAPGQ